MQETEADARRLKKLLKHYKRENFQKSLDKSLIESDGITVECVVQKINGIRVIRYITLVDGRLVKTSERTTDQIRNMFNDVYYYSPDSTTWYERLGFGLAYLAVCAGLVGIIFFAHNISQQQEQKKPVIASETQHAPQKIGTNPAVVTFVGNRSH